LRAKRKRFPIKVLCVEDDPDSRQYLVDTVTAAGHEAMAAGNGLAGFECFAAFRPDLVLCDIRMPGMNGLELLAAMRKQSAGVAVVMLTAFGCEEYAIKALREGANDYLKKPIRHADLLPLLEKYAEGRGGGDDLARTNQRLLDINSALRQEIKNQAELLVQSDKMAAIGTLSAGLSHEISNSMLLVVCNLSWLADSKGKFKELLDKYRGIETVLRNTGSPEAANEEIRKLIESKRLAGLQQEVLALLDDAMDGAMEVDVLLKDLKTFSRLDSAEFAPADLNERVDFALKMTQPRLRNKVVVKKKYGEMPPVNCSAQKIGQVFVNILLNAEQAMEAGGAITITSRLAPRPTGGGAWAEVIFADTGRGIPRDKLARVFEPFFTTKPVGEGTGLGLYIARAILADHGGAIAVDSVEGEGTTVTVGLPTNNIRSE